jgi:hypothetical protein
MWGKIAFAVVFWIASIVGVTQLIQALPLSPGGGDNFQDPYTMILLGSALLLLAILMESSSKNRSKGQSA